MDNPYMPLWVLLIILVVFFLISMTVIGVVTVFSTLGYL